MDDESILHYIEGEETLDLDTLRNHLWQAADILRGSIDSADNKNYTFGLLFLKQVNDRFDEEIKEIAEEHDIPEETVRDDRDLHKEFWVPERARRAHVMTRDENEIDQFSCLSNPCSLW